MSRLAGDLLRSSLVGLETLFERVGIDLWRGAASRLLDLHDPDAMAAGYQRMSQGSAPGTFYDLIISGINGHAVTEAQEPWVNQLLTTFQAVAAVASGAIAGEGPSAGMPVPSGVAARRYPWHPDGAAGLDRSRLIIYSVVCTTCGTRSLLDTAVAEAAALRWSLGIAPQAIEDDRSPDLVTAALDPDDDAETRHAMEAVQPAADALGLVTVRRPYNRPGGQPNDECGVCGADTWRAGPLQVQEDPVRFVPLS